MSTMTVPGNKPSIQAAVHDARDGDTIIVEGHTKAEPTLYSERVAVNTPAKSLTIRAEPRRSALTHGFVTSGAGEGLTIEGFGVTIPDASILHACYIDSDNVTLRDVSVRNAPWAAFYCNERKPEMVGGVIERCHAYGCGAGIHTTGVGWLVQFNDVERLVNRLGKDPDYSRAWGTDALYRGNHFHGSIESEIGSGHVDGLQTFDSGGRHMRGLQFLDNIVEDCHTGVILADLDDPGDVENVLIAGNWFRNIWGTGVYARNVVRDVRVHHNLFEQMGLKGVFVRWGAEVDVTANIFFHAGSNYHADSGSTLTGGFNILNRQRFPRFSMPTDLLDIDPVLDADGFQTDRLALRLAGDGLPIGRIRPEVTTEDPDPEQHEHDGILDRLAAAEDNIIMHDHAGDYDPAGHGHENTNARLRELEDDFATHGHPGKADIGHDHLITDEMRDLLSTMDPVSRALFQTEADFLETRAKLIRNGLA